MMKILQLLFLLLFLWSCGHDNQPAVVYQDDSVAQELQVDSTLVVTSGLPIHFEHTDYLLFPVGSVQGYRDRSAKIYLGSGSYGDNSFTIGYLSGTTYNGQLDDIKIQHVDSSNFKSLNTQRMKIRSFQFLETIREEIGLQLLVLEATDRDTNGDGELTGNDVKSLYIAHLSGNGFKKLSADNHELLDWRTVNSRLYFRSLEDINKDGEFDTEDKVHHYYVNLENDFEVVEYNPIG